MPKKIFKKMTPSHEKIKEQKILKIFGDKLYEQKLWSCNRKEVALAFLIGLFVAFIPIPFQMLVSAFLAILFQANLPLAVLLVWITNPITMPIIFYAEYYLGSLLLGEIPITLSNFSLDNDFAEIATSLYFGGFLTAVVISLTSFVVITQGWIYIVKKRYSSRKAS